MMTGLAGVPDGIQQFVQRRLASVAELEGLLLMRSSPEQLWDARELATRLYIGEPHARLVLEALHRAGLMARYHESFLYRPASESLHDEVEALAAAYPRLLIPITELIHAKMQARRAQT